MQLLHSGQGVQNLLGHTFAEVALVALRTHIGEWENRDRSDRLRSTLPRNRVVGAARLAVKFVDERVARLVSPLRVLPKASRGDGQEV